MAGLPAYYGAKTNDSLERSRSGELLCEEGQLKCTGRPGHRHGLTLHRGLFETPQCPLGQAICDAPVKERAGQGNPQSSAVLRAVEMYADLGTQLLEPAGRNLSLVCGAH